MKVAVIGAGWMGAHISNVLNIKGYDVKIFESKKKIFLGMSGYNTNRLHMGYHYPRSLITRKQSINGYNKFIKEYPNLYKKITNNFIGIANKKTRVNFKKYKKIMIASGLQINQINKLKFKIKNIEGLIKTKEGLILQDKAANFFYKKIKNFLILGKSPELNQFKEKKVILNNEEYDWIIDCSGSNWRKNNIFNISFEPRVTFVYKSKIKDFALMVLDGNFFTLYPHKKNLYTLGSVKYSRFKKFKNLKSATIFSKNISKKEIVKRKEMSEKIVLNFFPKFKKYFFYNNYYKSMTTLFNSKKDSRPTLVNKKKRLITVLGGKIDTIFEAEREVLNIIRNF